MAPPLKPGNLGGIIAGDGAATGGAALIGGLADDLARVLGKSVQPAKPPSPGSIGPDDIINRRRGQSLPSGGSKPDPAYEGILDLNEQEVLANLQGKKTKAAKAPTAPSAAGQTGKGIDLLETADNVNNIAGFATMAPPALHGVGWVAERVGAKKMSAALKKPHAFFGQSFEAVGKRLNLPVPKLLKDTSASDGIMNATFVLSPILGAAKGVRNLVRSREALDEIDRDIQADTDNKNPLASKDDDKLKPAGISSEIAKDAISLAVNAGVGLLGARSFIKTKGAHVPFLTFIGPMLADMGLSMFMPSGGLDAYKNVKETIKSGQKVTAEQYAELIGTQSHELQVRGGAGSEFTKAVAERLAAEQLSAAAVMKLVRSDGLQKRYIDPVIAEHDAKKAAETPKDAVASVKAQPAHSHRDIIGGSKLNRAERVTVGDGKFTGGLMQEAKKTDALNLLPNAR